MKDVKLYFQSGCGTNDKSIIVLPVTVENSLNMENVLIFVRCMGFFWHPPERRIIDVQLRVLSIRIISELPPTNSMTSLDRKKVEYCVCMLLNSRFATAQNLGNS